MSKNIRLKDHEFFMREAIQEARIAVEKKESNRPVGAVIVLDGEIIGKGHARNSVQGSKISHAELNALLDSANTLYHLKERTHHCIIYTTLEPCVMCLGAIVHSDIDHIVFGMYDKWINPAQLFQSDYVNRHIKLYMGGVLDTECEELWKKHNPEEYRMIKSGTR